MVHIFAFKFRVEHVRDSQNIVADSLFRMLGVPGLMSTVDLL